jgi:integrase/recombinase XerC
VGRPSKIRYREDRDAWVTTIGGRYVTLARGKRSRAEATKEFHRLMSRGRAATDPASISVGELCDRLLDWVQVNRAPLTYDWYRQQLSSFVRYVGQETPANALRPLHVEDWIKHQAWGQTSRHHAITAVKRAFRWGKKMGYVEVNHFGDMDCPPILRRELVLTPVEEQAVLAAANPRLRDYLTMMHETGCRPSEVARMEAQHVSGNVVTMPGKTSRATGRSRVVYLAGRAVEIVARLSAYNPIGPIFLNMRGRPWNRTTLAQAMHRVRVKVKGEVDGPGWKACTAESFRHGWVTDAKLRLPNSVVAELAGHTSTAMVDRHYGHLNERRDDLARAAGQVRGVGTDNASATPSEAPPSKSGRSQPDQP